MKLATCLMCGMRFVQYHPREHTCPSCDGAVDEFDEREAKREKEKKEP